MRAVLLFLFLLTAAAAADIHVATLNCFLLFNPELEHRGELDSKHPLTAEDYQQKISNLVSLMKDYEVVGLQETGGPDEIAALAKAGGYEWLFTKGKDTYTGQEVGALYRLPGWTVSSASRVPELDRIVSKHLLFSASKDGELVRFLVVHLVRPIGKQAVKHENQIAAIGRWSAEMQRAYPKDTVVVLGDTNSDRTPLFSFGSEAGSNNRWAATHLGGKPFDRLVAVRGRWSGVQVKRPPYGKSPNNLQKKLWSDHFLLGAILTTSVH
jgi:hypothetical protein